MHTATATILKSNNTAVAQGSSEDATTLVVEHIRKLAESYGLECDLDPEMVIEFEPEILKAGGLDQFFEDLDEQLTDVFLFRSREGVERVHIESNFYHGVNVQPA
ncbi:hypothetical protein ABIF00_000058 [Bradyrhizobium elkanii]